MRLRPLTEAECYARCYGGRRGEAAGVIRVHTQRDWDDPAASGRDSVEPPRQRVEPGRDLEAA